MKTYVWGLPTRIFHMLLVICISGAWLSAEDETLLLHAAFGYASAVLILFRLFWGVLGPKYSRFKDFNLSIKKAFSFSKQVLSNSKAYLAHNPAASLTLFVMLFLILFVSISGMFTLAQEEGRGLFAFLFTSKGELFEEVHELLANVMLLFILTHLLGVLIDRLLHKEHNTLSSILNGYKNIKGESVCIKPWQTAFATLFFIAVLVVFFMTLTKTLPFY